MLTLDLLAKGFRYAEVPISYRFRRHGRSFVRLGPYLRQVVPAVRRELRTPDPAGPAQPAPPAGAAPTVTPARSSVLDHEAAEPVAGVPPALGVEGAVGP